MRNLIALSLVGFSLVACTGTQPKPVSVSESPMGLWTNPPLKLSDPSKVTVNLSMKISPKDITASNVCETENGPLTSSVTVPVKVTGDTIVVMESRSYKSGAGKRVGDVGKSFSCEASLTAGAYKYFVEKDTLTFGEGAQAAQLSRVRNAE